MEHYLYIHDIWMVVVSVWVSTVFVASHVNVARLSALVARKARDSVSVASGVVPPFLYQLTVASGSPPVTSQVSEMRSPSL